MDPYVFYANQQASSVFLLVFLEVNFFLKFLFMQELCCFESRVFKHALKQANQAVGFFLK